MRIFNLSYQVDFRRLLRKRKTSAEAILWEHLKNKKLGHKFRRQYGIDRYIVDFYCPEAKLVVEVDGYFHSLPKQRAYDKEREEFMKTLGIKTLRYANRNIEKSAHRVLKEILLQIYRRLS